MRLILKLFLLVSVVLATLVGIFAWWANTPIRIREPTVDFRIASGSSLRAAAAQMQEAGVAIDPDLLALLAREPVELDVGAPMLGVAPVVAAAVPVGSGPGAGGTAPAVGSTRSTG